MDIFNKLPYISLLIHERVWLDRCKEAYSHDSDEYDRKYLYKDQISAHNVGSQPKPTPNQDEMDLDNSSLEKNSLDKTNLHENSTTLTKLIELDDEDCYEYDPEILESPLSPDGESLRRNSKIGLDVWKWSRESAPLGYSPPLCTCKNLNMLYKSLMTLQTCQYLVIEEFKTCNDENCSGLLYIPFSLIEVPLNRKIDNAMSFTSFVKIPDNTDIYCGNLKHTLVLCTTNLQHELECLNAIREAGLKHYLIYNVVNNDSIIPFFNPIIENNDIPLINSNDKSNESKALTLLLDEGDDRHSQSAVSGQFMITIHKLQHNKLAISNILKNQYGEFKPIDQYFFDNLKKYITNNDFSSLGPSFSREKLSLGANEAFNEKDFTREAATNEKATNEKKASNEKKALNTPITSKSTSATPTNEDESSALRNYNEYKILETYTIKCNMLDSFSKDRRPLNLQLRYVTRSNFDTIENILGLSANDLASSDKPLKIDNQTKHHIIGTLYKLGISNQLYNEI